MLSRHADNVASHACAHATGSSLTRFRLTEFLTVPASWNTLLNSALAEFVDRSMDVLLHSHAVPVLCISASFYVIVGAIYRLIYSPIARYPGPRLAALTFWYEFYYDVVCKGRYTWKIQELHQTYGPIVRINPKELHVADPAFYDSVYVGPGRRTEKWEYSARIFGTTSAAVGTIGHDLHRIRRGALNGFFSKRIVANFTPTIQELVNHGSELLRRRGTKGRVLNLRDFFAACSADVIGIVAFGSNYGLLDKDDFEPAWQKLMIVRISPFEIKTKFDRPVGLKQRYPHRQAISLDIYAAQNHPAIDSVAVPPARHPSVQYSQRHQTQDRGDTTLSRVSSRQA